MRDRCPNTDLRGASHATRKVSLAYSWGQKKHKVVNRKATAQLFCSGREMFRKISCMQQWLCKLNYPVNARNHDSCQSPHSSMCQSLRPRHMVTPLGPDRNIHWQDDESCLKWLWFSLRSARHAWNLSSSPASVTPQNLCSIHPDCRSRCPLNRPYCSASASLHALASYVTDSPHQNAMNPSAY